MYREQKTLKHSVLNECLHRILRAQGDIGGERGMILGAIGDGRQQENNFFHTHIWPQRGWGSLHRASQVQARWGPALKGGNGHDLSSLTAKLIGKFVFPKGVSLDMLSTLKGRVGGQDKTNTIIFCRSWRIF